MAEITITAISTPDNLGQYMLAQVKDVMEGLDDLTWTLADLSEDVTDVLLDLNTSADKLADADQRLLRKQARIAIWRKMAGATVADADNYDADGLTIKAQTHQKALDMLALEGVYTKPKSSGSSSGGTGTAVGGGVAAHRGKTLRIKQRSPYALKGRHGGLEE